MEYAAILIGIGLFRYKRCRTLGVNGVNKRLTAITVMLDHFLADLACLLKRAASMRVVPARTEEKADPVVRGSVFDLVLVLGERKHGVFSPVRFSRTVRPLDVYSLLFGGSKVG
jgi:hypothetical protein